MADRFSFVSSFVMVMVSLTAVRVTGAEAKQGAPLARPIPRAIFGQNIEHTRACVQDGLSAQLVRNRKFAGKPQHSGVAMDWTGYGEKGVFEHLATSFTRHVKANAMYRFDELHSQMVTCLDPAGEAGIRQDGVALRAGVSHTFRAALRVFPGDRAEFVCRVRQNGRVAGERAFAIAAARDMDWKKVTFSFTPETTGFGQLEVGIRGSHAGVVGVVSLMADDNFRGMRADVVAQLGEIGTSIVRWPGGNFAGQYRWRDGYVADPDERAPLQTSTKAETHPYMHGYDCNDISPDDILALCERIGAVPFFTIDPQFTSPADSVEWLARTQGKVRHWSLGNEFGYPHQEGPDRAADYAKLVRPHAEAMLKADPSLRLCIGGFVPGPDEWIRDAALPLNGIAPVLSYHYYCNPGPLAFGTEDRIRETYANVEKSLEDNFVRMYDYRAKLPAQVRLSVDEWNLWAAWYREDGPLEGLYIARTLHRYMKEWEKLGIEDVCYFQAVNENAIRVTPHASRLTSIGHAFRLMRAHAGGLPVAGNFPTDVFATDAGEGTRYVTCLNFNPYAPCTYAIPAGARAKIVGGELLEADGLATGARFLSKRPTAEVANGTCRLTLPPASILCVRLAPEYR